MAPVLVYNINDVIEIQLKGLLNTRPTCVTATFKSKHNTLTIANISDDIVFWANNMRAVQHPSHRWIGYRHRRQVPLPVSEWGDVAMAHQVGVQTGAPLPAQMALLFRIRTGLDAPAGKGRFYIPGIPQDWYNGFQFIAPYSTSITHSRNNMFNHWKVGGGSGHMFMGVRSRQVVPNPFNGMQDMSYADYPACQRRRGPF
jgi:hypothetical protein